MMARLGISVGRGHIPAVLAALAFCAPGSAATPGPLGSFAGHWQGGGLIALGDGWREAIRCKATYAAKADGDALNIHADCASDSYRVRILSDIIAQGTALSGDWKEVIRQVQGSVTGWVLGPGKAQAGLQAFGVGMRLSARTDVKQQGIPLRVQARMSGPSTSRCAAIDVARERAENVASGLMRQPGTAACSSR